MKSVATRLANKDYEDVFNKATLLDTDFSIVMDLYNREDVLFVCDPAYLGTLGYSSNYGEKDNVVLYNKFINSKAKIMIVVAESQQIRELFGDYIKAEYVKNYDMKNFNGVQEGTKHLIITNYDV